MIFLSACRRDSTAVAPQTTTGTTSFALERANAQRMPYANDLGPDTVDVSAYPAGLQSAYRDILLTKCQRCHSAARTLNAEFVEPTGTPDQETAKIAEWRRTHPEWFADPLVWKIEGPSNGTPGIWMRYIRRMSAKPGTDLTEQETQRLWEFLRYDSEQRKVGAHAAEWAAQRQGLLEKFKKQSPDRYRELYETH